MRSLGLFVMGITGGWFLHLHLARPIPAPAPVAYSASPVPNGYVNPLTRGAYDKHYGVAHPPTIYWTAPAPTPIPR